MGETYQINYTSRYDFNFIGDIYGFYDRLKKHQKVSYSALIHYNGNTIISGSTDGDANAEFQIVLEGRFTLAQADFIL